MIRERIDYKERQLIISDKFGWLIITILIMLIAIIRLRLLQTPLERDEGEYAYIGQLILQGIPPYLLAYSMKLPGIYFIYALAMAIFGQTIAGIHLGLLIANIIAIILLFLLVRRLFNNFAAVIAAASYAFLSLSPALLGASAHATQFIVPFVLGGTIFLMMALDSYKYRYIIFSGLLFGLGFIIKQHAVFFIAFAIIHYINITNQKRPSEWKRMLNGTVLLVLSSAVPFIVVCSALYMSGVFTRFWFWTFTYAHQYVSEIPIAGILPNLYSGASWVMKSWEWLWILAGLGLTTIFWDNNSKSNASFLSGFSLFSFLSICPGFYFRYHYFILILPAISILAGVFLSAVAQLKSHKRNLMLPKIILMLSVASAFLITFVKLSGFFFQANPIEACRMMYWSNPFPESIQLSEYIKNNSTKNDTVAVLGSEPQICFYANRKSATGYIYVYGLMEPQEYALRMQHEMIREIEKACPKFIVTTNCPPSWLKNPNSNLTIWNWANLYLDKYYQKKLTIDLTGENTVQVFKDGNRKHKPRSDFNMIVFERVSE